MSVLLSTVCCVCCPPPAVSVLPPAVSVLPYTTCCVCCPCFNLLSAICRFPLLLFLLISGAYRCSAAGCFPSDKAGEQPPPPAKHLPTPAPPLAKFHTPPPPPPPPRVYHVPAAPPAKKAPPPPPAKKMPTCVYPVDFGRELDMSAIQDCQSLKVMAERGKLHAVSEVTGDKCDWLEIEDCGTGDGKRFGESALTRFRNRIDNDLCLVFDTLPKDGQLRLQDPADDDAVVPLCCTPICDEEPTDDREREELLTLDEE
eukprot:GHVS01095829.1.p1 GENE.GHVS01095829.1~~GHVS01095829.1.p1  ORF type:complete len:257 (+),score=55.71 GHVS01095829.1:213-983(+)